jgi:hypothetical protein
MASFGRWSLNRALLGAMMQPGARRRVMLCRVAPSPTNEFLLVPSPAPDRIYRPGVGANTASSKAAITLYQNVVVALG